MRKGYRPNQPGQCLFTPPGARANSQSLCEKAQKSRLRNPHEQRAGNGCLVRFGLCENLWVYTHETAVAWLESLRPWARLGLLRGLSLPEWFQSTRPCGERPGDVHVLAVEPDVSIHAPVWGATRDAHGHSFRLCSASGCHSASGCSRGNPEGSECAENRIDKERSSLSQVKFFPYASPGASRRPAKTMDETINALWFFGKSHTVV